MTKFSLTLLDTTGIQEYIFSSNRLQENIGASEIVYRATTLWAFQVLEKRKISHNILPPQNLQLSFTTSAIEEEGDLQAEVIQAAGGNTLILFREKETAIDFVKALTLRVLTEAPGLTLLAQHLHDFDFESHGLIEARKELEARMRQHKMEYLPSTPLLGLAVTAMCDSTGLPAVNTLRGSVLVEGRAEPIGLEGEIRTGSPDLVSRQTTAKRGWRTQANLRLSRWLKPAADDYKFPFDLEKIGRIKGEESYIAVVHADGNRMGHHVKGVAHKVQEKFAGQPLKKINREYILAIREFSGNVNGASLAALDTVVGLTVQAVKNKAIPFETENGVPYLPLRPLVYGGDDVTFVCNGSIGLELAAAYLDTFHREAEARGLIFHASVGVAIVKMHYPFARAYKLSEELAGSAKSLTRETDCSALDWHFAQSGLSGSLPAIRSREYKVGAGWLRRPLTLTGWQQVHDVIEAFNNDYWGRKHNKVIGLREPLRKGPEAVRKYRQDFELKELPGFEGLDVQQSGWLGDTCYYFEAVELLDHHVSLNTKEVAK